MNTITKTGLRITNKIPAPLRKKRYLAILLVFCIVGGYFLFKTKNPTTYEYATVKRADIKTTVEGSGSVTTLKEVELKTLSSGQLTAVLVKPGDKVARGQIIARLDGRSASIQVTQAKANYDKVVNGVTTEESKVAQLSLDNAKATLEMTKKEQDLLVTNAYRSFLNTSIQARSTSDTQSYDIPTISGNYTCDTQGVYTFKTYQSTGGISANFSGLESGTVLVSDVERLFGSCGLYISFPKGATVNADANYVVEIPNKSATNYTSSYNTYTTVLKNKEKSIASAQQSVDTAQASFDLKIAHARPEDIASARASLDNAYLSYDNTLVKAPFDGYIGTVAVQIGEQVSSGTAVATLLTNSKVAEISLNEVDVAQIQNGQKVDLSFDAVPSLLLPGTVSEIDSLGTVDQNVVSFKVKIVFDQDDERIKSGMSVTGSIITKESKEVLVVPNGTIKNAKSKKYVEVAIPGAETSKIPNKRVFIEVGLSNDIETEVTSGLTEGDKVVTRTVSTSTSTKAKPATSLIPGGNSGRGGGGFGSRPN